MSRKNDAFTLLEMLITLAITGIMLAVAIPNYRKYQARTRQQEARTALTVIYTVEQTFFSDTGSFSACLKQIGADRSQEPMRYYSSGFNYTYTPGPDWNCGKNGDQCCDTYTYTFSGISDQRCSAADQSFAATIASPNTSSLTADPSAPLGTVLKAQKYDFTAGAGGYIGVPSSRDIWTIDQNKNLINIQSGL